MKAVRIHARGGPEQLFYGDAPQPQPTEGEVLVQVYATAVTPTELGWSTTWQTRTGAARHFPIPGHDLAGVVAGVGPGVTSVTVGEAVYALTDFHRDGAEAEFTIALPSELAPKPRTLDYVQAAAVPHATADDAVHGAFMTLPRYTYTREDACDARAAQVTGWQSPGLAMSPEEWTERLQGAPLHNEMPS